MVRSHSRLPFHRPGPPNSPDGPFPGNPARLSFPGADVPTERYMLKFLGSAMGIIFLIGLVVVILLLKLIF